MEGRPTSESTFAIVANGTGPSPPASGLLGYLLEVPARRVVTTFHPLEPEDAPRHSIVVYERGEETERREVRLPSRPPYTYVFDPFVPLWPERVDGWFGFNNLAVARGLLARRLGRARTVVYWAVDFVPDRFGTSLVTRAYDALDGYCCRHADARFELVESALRARGQRHGLDATGAPALVVPMGAWVKRTPVTPEDGHRARRIVFIGHLIPRMGVGQLLDALAMLAARGVEFEADIAGKGPLEPQVCGLAARLGGRLRFRGFIDDQDELARLVASGSVGLAPFDPVDNDVTPHADPGKLKSYLAAGLPIVMTGVPPNSAELAQYAGAEIVSCDPEGLADGIERAFASPEEWRRRRAAALTYAKRFDWTALLEGPLAELGFLPG